jgi:pimeloyl-ACP methyl ester carboxylesterase
MSVELPWSPGFRISSDVTPDAVVVVPGIMGSTLRDTVTGEVVWGLRPRWYAQAWRPGGPGLSPLAVTEDELAGARGRVEAVGLLKFPAFLPFLGGLEPYTPLMRAIKTMVRHPAAVLGFGYDWRLSVSHNATLLAAAVRDHLDRWRTRSQQSDAKVVLVAHSMGGLLCQALPTIAGMRAVITLGTPFGGAAKAAMILSSGTGGPLPLPADRLRRVALTMPGIYDLLPTYRCVDEGDSVRRLSPSDIAGLGGVKSLAENVFDHRERCGVIPMTNHHALVGAEQPTMSSLTLDAGTATACPHTFKVDDDGEVHRDTDGRLKRFLGLGDGTVPRNASLPAHRVPLMPLAQQHATLAASDEAITFVRQILLHGTADQGPRLGSGDVGLTLPDVVAAGKEWTATLTGIEPYHSLCTIADADTGQEVAQLDAQSRDGTTQVSITLPAPGLYRVRVDGGSTPVTQFVLATGPATADRR